MTVKRLEKALLRAEERLHAKLDSAKDPGITFEATGIDYLCVDEAHGYKNLRTPSNISRRRDRRVHARLRPGHEDRLPAPPQRRAGWSPSPPPPRSPTRSPRRT